jgi:hypothetical protein
MLVCRPQEPHPCDGQRTGPSDSPTRVERTSEGDAA